MMRRTLGIIAVVLVLASPVLPQNEKAQTTSQREEGGSVLFVYGDEANANGFVQLTESVGLSCSTMPQEEFTWGQGDVQLIVTLPCCSGREWSKGVLDRCGDSRILAMGDSGAALLGTKSLLVGHPHGAQGTRLPKAVVFPKEVVNSRLGGILLRPRRLITGDEESVRIQIHHGAGKLHHVGIYDSGRFPKGTTGIGRGERTLHHWMIAKQGNFVLWGADSRADNLSEDGKNLLVNLCWYLVHAQPELLIFPEKAYLKLGDSEHVLIGGARDKFWLKPFGLKGIRLTLEWQASNTMMFMTHNPRKRVDGRSPLTIKHDISRRRGDGDMSIVVHSFRLPEGKQCKYRVRIEPFEFVPAAP